jgi:hypothetical protein
MFESSFFDAESFDMIREREGEQNLHLTNYMQEVMGALFWVLRDTYLAHFEAIRLAAAHEVNEARLGGGSAQFMVPERGKSHFETPKVSESLSYVIDSIRGLDTLSLLWPKKVNQPDRGYQSLHSHFSQLLWGDFWIIRKSVGKVYISSL